MKKIKHAVLLLSVCLIAGADFLATFGTAWAEPSGAVLAEQPISAEKLLGSWLRSDGNYLLEIKKVRQDGTLDAAYFNPNPIHVAKAKYAQEQGETLSVFIELQDKGYPGSSYSLRYNAARDMLEGTYFHAGIQQTFEVAFSRSQQQGK